MTSGQPPAPAISMSDRTRRILLEERRRHSTGQRLCSRLDILLLAREGHSNSEISRRTGATHKTVRKWRRRWNGGHDKLLAFEQGKDGRGASDTELRRYLLGQLRDRPRPGAPKTITAAQEQQIIALACEKPGDYGIPRTDWTHGQLARTAVEKDILPGISSSQVGRVLKNKPAPTT
ncbi:MAG TPA: helix-turn-helix domain-containing protein [Bacteroidetes bacterium]|nr:helix-turn-helix domain-containing protein [Bacteroidota bacterium]